MFQRSFSCHSYLTHSCIILLSLPHSSLFSLYLLRAFGGSRTADHIVAFRFRPTGDLERRGRRANVFNEHRRLPPALHTTVTCAQRVASFPAVGPGWKLEVIETSHTTCTAALAACVRTSEDDKKIEPGSRGAFEVASVAALTVFVLVFVLISRSRTQFTELRVYFTAV